jgi:hypothetical protein
MSHVCNRSLTSELHTAVVPHASKLTDDHDFLLTAHDRGTKIKWCVAAGWSHLTVGLTPKQSR